MKSGERETYLPGSGYTEGSSNNGSGHGGFPLLMFVPFSLFFSGSWLVRPLFLGLFVPCSCFQLLLSLFSCSLLFVCSLSLCSEDEGEAGVRWLLSPLGSVSSVFWVVLPWSFPLLLCPIFSVQDEDDGGLSTRSAG